MYGLGVVAYSTVSPTVLFVGRVVTRKTVKADLAKSDACLGMGEISHRNLPVQGGLDFSNTSIAPPPIILLLSKWAWAS